ncbi:hypothetical protein BD779DRAFT_1532106 [Infundibulicybe gibba]|nr:hypothetical protein BD779DRAFT_1532106 [Infundibulicybe gibba]
MIDECIGDAASSLQAAGAKQPNSNDMDPSLLYHPHRPFYFIEGNIVFKVQDTYYKLWDAPFRYHSQRFCAEHGLPTLDDVLHGSNGVHPHIDDASALNCGMSHPQNLNSSFPSSSPHNLMIMTWRSVIGEYKSQTSADWISILDISTRWAFPAVRALALTRLAQLPIDHIYRLDLAQTYVALCARPTPLSAAEMAHLGTDITARITAARERLGANRNAECAWGYRGGVAVVGDGVRRAFGGVVGMVGGMVSRASPGVLSTSSEVGATNVPDISDELRTSSASSASRKVDVSNAEEGDRRDDEK